MKLLDKYEWNPDTDLLGQGAFARVYKADNGRKNFVALKVADKASVEGPVNEGSRDKYSLEEEYAKGRDLSHTHLIHYVDLEYIVHTNFMQQQVKYAVLIMEYADKGSLEDKFTNGEIPGNDEAKIKRIAREILNGLDYLHSQGIVHRDLKPANILFKTDKVGNEIVKLADFGISRDMLSKEQSSVATVVGSVPYMAPEQFLKRKYGLDGSISNRTDIWALGVIFYRMLTGKLPFGHASESYEEVRDDILETEPDYSTVPAQYLAVIKACLKKNAVERPEDEAAVLALLGNRKQAPPPTPPVAVDKPFDPNATIFQGSSEFPDRPRAPAAPRKPEAIVPPQRRVDTPPSPKEPGKRNSLGITIFVVVVVVLVIFIWAQRSGSHKGASGADSVATDTTKMDSAAKVPLSLKIDTNRFYFTDDFSDNSKGWPLSSDSLKQMNVVDNSLRIKGISSHYSYYSTQPFSIDTVKDFTVTLKAEWITGIKINGFGIDYCSNALSVSHCIFYISADGEYCIRYFQNNGSWQNIADWTKSTYINQNRQLNSLMLKKEGAYLFFFINGHFIEKHPFKGFGNSFGVRVSSAQTIDFEDFTLSGTKL